YSINVSQINDELDISGEISYDNYYIKELWLFCRDSNSGYKINEQKPFGKFCFKVSLKGLFDKLKVNDEEKTFDLYFKVRRPACETENIKKNFDEIEFIEESKEVYAEYLIRCGRFQNTHIDNLSFLYQGDHYLIPYITTHGNLSIAFNREPDSPTRLQIDKVKSKKEQFIVKGKIFSRNSIIDNGTIAILGRETGIELTSEILKIEYLKQEVTKKYGLNRYTYEAKIDFTKMNRDMILPEDIYDLFFKLKLHDKHEVKYVRVGRPAFRAKLLLKDLYAKSDREAIIINPYYTFKQEN